MRPDPRPQICEYRPQHFECAVRRNKKNQPSPALLSLEHSKLYPTIPDWNGDGRSPHPSLVFSPRDPTPHRDSAEIQIQQLIAQSINSIEITETTHASSRDCRRPLCLVSTFNSSFCYRFFWIGKAVSQHTEVFNIMYPSPNSSASDVLYAMREDLRGLPVQKK